MNAVLFVLLTKQVRDSFLQLFYCRRQYNGRSDGELIVGDLETSYSVRISEKKDTRLSRQVERSKRSNSVITPETQTS